MFDINYPRFLSMLRHVVLRDIESYYIYYAGLCDDFPEQDERDEAIDVEKLDLRAKVAVDLQRISDDLFEQANEHKNYKDKKEEKDF